MEEITETFIIERCWNCGGIYQHRVYTNWPKVEPGTRPEAEHRAAQTPANWDEGTYGSDNLDARKKP